MKHSLRLISLAFFLITILLQQTLVVNSAQIIIVKRYIDDKALDKEPLEEKVNNEGGDEKDANLSHNQSNKRKEKSNDEKASEKEEKSKSNNQETDQKQEKLNSKETDQKQEKLNSKETDKTEEQDKSSKEEINKKDKQSKNEKQQHKSEDGKSSKDPTWGANAAAKSDVNAEMVFKPTKGKSEWRKPDNANDGTGTVEGGERNDEIPDFFAGLA